MTKRSWTPAQEEAIYAKWIDGDKSSNILVNAAAGSGKTAVLVERIIEKLSENERDPRTTDVDRLLVVTFTNAAAAEMKERVAKALTGKLRAAQSAGDFAAANRFKNQLSLLRTADITTIDAFCMKLLKNYFHLLEIDPNFKIVGQEKGLLEDEAMEELFEECYSAQNESFLLLARLYSESRDDRALAQIILEVYNFLQSLPNPEEWLLEKTNAFLENPWGGYLLEQKNKLVRQAKASLEHALSEMYRYTLGKAPDTDFDAFLAAYPDEEENEVYLAWGTYYHAIVSEYGTACRLLDADWDESFQLFSELSFLALNKRPLFQDKSRTVKDAEEKAVVKAYRDAAKEALLKASGLISGTREEESCQLSERVYPAACALSELVLGFSKKYAEKKAEKNLLEFSDIEHLCLKLLLEHEEVRKELQEKYDEILMDEYQDTNALQESIFHAVSRGDNFFMVGDMKQCIYQFRNSDPTIFKEKCDTYLPISGAENRKITLSANFRSRIEVLDSVNAVFSRMMSEEVGDLVYDEEHWLNLGNTTYQQKNECGYQSECYVLESRPSDSEDEESLDKVELEARFIAGKIRALKDSGYLVREGEEYRPIENRDITILMSSHKAAAEIYTAELSRFGISCYAETGGYFEKNEVRMVLSLIKILQNPRQDIPLLGVLRSPIGRFSDHELTEIRTHSPGSILDAVVSYSREENELARRLSDFLDRLARWRGYAHYMTCDRLLWTLYEETGIYSFAGALIKGEEAQANLRLLFERAKAYEASGYRGLFHFIRYMERLSEREENINSAKMVGEEHDVVRIMTIHKSKGLEFPVVFLAGCGKQFRNDSAKIPMHRRLGLGLEEINFEKSYRMPTAAKKAVTLENRREQLSEEARKLYVALTRAKEKLIVPGVVNEKGGAETLEKRWKSLLPFENSVMSPFAAAGAKSFFDWICPAAMVSEEWHYESVPYDPMLPAEETKYETRQEAKEKIRISDFCYPYADSVYLPTKVSVTELKRLSQASQAAQMAAMPAFLAGEGKLRGAAAGTALHTAMQKIIPKPEMDTDWILSELARLCGEHVLTEAERECISVDAILKFYQGTLGARVLAAKRVYREQTFELLLPAKELYPEETSEEKILLQGVIDCYFEEPDGIVLIDYKSDYYTDSADMRDKYAVQLGWYKRVLERILKKPVKECYLYLFYRHEELLVEV